MMDVMEITYNTTTSGNCGMHILIYMRHQWKLLWNQGTLKNILSQGVYLNPLTGQNGLKNSFWDV